MTEQTTQRRIGQRLAFALAVAAASLILAVATAGSAAASPAPAAGAAHQVGARTHGHLHPMCFLCVE